VPWRARADDDEHHVNAIALWAPIARWRSIVVSGIISGNAGAMEA
jgi:hypothetical protein